MIRCHACGHENIEGNFDCESCSTPLSLKPKQGLDAHIEEGTIADIGPRVAVSVAASLPLDQAIEKMRAHHMGCVLVVENKKMRGIMTERDLLFGLAGGKNAADMTVEDIMHADPVCLKIDDPVSYAFHHMSIGGYRHIPIHDGNKPIGMISARDLLRFLTRSTNTES